MKRRVLIADDAVFMRMMLRDIIVNKLGLEVAGEAANGHEAVAKYKELRPDLLTLDITMPLQDGISALRDIMTEDPAANIIMISALGQHNKVTEALAAGAKDFIIKPFNPGKVIEILKKYV